MVILVPVSDFVLVRGLRAVSEAAAALSVGPHAEQWNRFIGHAAVVEVVHKERFYRATKRLPPPSGILLALLLIF